MGHEAILENATTIPSDCQPVVVGNNHPIAGLAVNRMEVLGKCTSEPCFSNELFGISSTYFALVGIFFAVMFSVTTIGFLYDQVFSLWTEWRSVDMERNPT